MFYTQSECQASNLIDFILVIVGPSALWAPEQFEHTKTPKSKEAPE